MTKRELLTVAIRLFAIGLALSIVRSIPGTALAFESSQVEPSAGPWLVAASYALAVAVALICWRFPLAVAALLLPKADASVELVPWSQQSAVETGTIIIGVFYLYYAASDLVYWMAFWVAYTNYEDAIAPISPDQWASIVTTVFEVVLAVGLVLGARRIASVIQSVRHAGTQPSN